MAGDRESELQDQEENGSAIRQPFLIGVSGGTASGKVRTFIFSTKLFISFLCLEINLLPFVAVYDVMDARAPAAWLLF